MLWEASADDTTATLSTGAPDPAVDAGAGLEAAGDGTVPIFLGATTTLLQREETNPSFRGCTGKTVEEMLTVPFYEAHKSDVDGAAGTTPTLSFCCSAGDGSGTLHKTKTLVFGVVLSL